MSTHRLFSCFLFVVAVTAVICVTACAQNPIAGANVNMVSGTTWPGGDPFLERQNEPTIAVSTRNPLHLLAGSNDYSTVQLGVITDRVTGDAWLRVYRSTDGGWTWRSTLLPGCPYSTPECMDSPVRNAGYQVGADPTIRAGSNGMFYFNFIAFNRGDNAPGAVTLARFIDDNNSDRAGAEPIRYLGTTIIATNTSGRLTDKPWMAVDIPRPGASTCVIPGTNGTPTQSFPAGNVYVAYAFIQGNDLNLRAKVYVATSTNCGVTFGKLIKVSEGSAIAQGAAVAVDPRPAPLGGALYVAWRQVQLQSNVNQPDAIMMVKSTDGGATFTKPTMVAAFEPFDQGASAVSFRTDSFPAMAVDETGRVYLVWQARVGPPASAPAAEKDARIVLSTSMDGLNWSAPVAVDEPPYTTYNPDHRGHQFMPSIAIAGGKVMVGYFDSRDDHTVGKLQCPVGKPTCTAADLVEVREAMGELEGSAGSSLVFNPFLADAIPPNYMSPLPQRRHTVDYRVAQASTTGSPQGFASTRVSQFLYGSPSKNPGVKPIQQLRFNVPNLPIFAKNTKGFVGDYTDAAALSMVPSGSGWAFNNTPCDAVVFHEVWTSNHDIRPPLDGNWANSSPPTYTGPFDPNLPRPTCTDANRTGMKNQNIYTSRITQGLEVGALQNAKKIATIDPNSPAFQRKFVVFVRNTKNKVKSYRLTIVRPLPAVVTASFKQTGPAVTTVDASITPRSTISQTVFLSSTDLTNSSPTVTVNVDEITGPGGAACDPSGCLHASVVLNADLTNTDLTNTDLTNTDLTNTDLTNADLTNTDLTNTDLTNTDLTNTDLTNTDLTNTDLTNMGVPVTDLTNADLTNTDLTNTDLTNTDLTNASMADATWKVTNKGNTGAAVSVKTLLKGGKLPQGYMAQLIVHKSYTTPAVAYGCDPKELTQTVVLANITSPKFLDPATAPITDLTNTDLTNTDLTNAVIPVGAGETVKVTLRFIVKDPAAPGVPKLCGPGLAPCAPGDFNPVDNVKPVPVPQTVIPGVPSPAIALVITTMSLPDGTTGVGYDQTVQAIGGSGARTWSVTSGSLPGGFSLNPSTGQITGTPAGTGTYSFKVQVVDSSTQNDTQNLTIRINTRATSTAVALSPAAVPVDQSSTVTVTVTDTDAGTKSFPTGTVVLASSVGSDVFSGPCNLAATAAPGVSTCSVSVAASTIGVHNITAAFTATSAHSASGPATAALTVNTRATTTAVTVAPPMVATGQSATVTVTVTDTDAGAKSFPSGTVQLTTPAPVLATSTCVLAPTGTQGRSACSVTGAATVAASYSIGAVFSATGTHSASSGSGTLTVTTFSASIASITPASAAAGFGQLIAISHNLPIPSWTSTCPVVAFYQSGASTPGFVFHGPSTQSVLFVRLPFVGDNNGTTGNLQLGPAFVQATCDGSSTNWFPLTVTGTPSTPGTPGTPVARFVLGLRATPAPSPGDPCGGGPQSDTPITTISAGQGIAVSAFGTDTAGSTAVFTQGANGWQVPSSCGTDSGTIGEAAAFAVPSALAVGPVSVQIKTTVNGITSALSDPLTLTVVAPLMITTSSLPDALVSFAYAQALQATGGTGPYSWSITSGSLPAGLSLDSATGLIQGVLPAVAQGPSTFTVQVTDSANPAHTATQQLTLTVQTATTLISIAQSGSSGDYIYRGFYITGYPGRVLAGVRLYLKAVLGQSGTHAITLTARSGSYDGPLIGQSTNLVMLNEASLTPVDFLFASRPVTLGSVVTFAITSSGGSSSAYYNVGPCGMGSGCDPGGVNGHLIIETEGTTPPLDTPRRFGVSLIVLGDN